MSNVQQINRATLKDIIAPALKSKLDELSKELGIELSYNGATFDYTGQNAKIKIAAAVVDGSGVAMTPERQDFLSLCEVYGLNKEMLDQEVTMGTLRLKVVGLKAKARKNNILLEEVGGSGYRVAPAAMVRQAFKASMADS